MIIGRRKFFSFFGTGVAMLAKPDLFIPKKEIVTVTADEFSTWVLSPIAQDLVQAMKNGVVQFQALYALAE